MASKIMYTFKFCIYIRKSTNAYLVLTIPEALCEDLGELRVFRFKIKC